ncbi:CHAD domain-containing protein [Candidatus Binatia bacterium]|nr:CHAD domain-containing protein [Candidatus Binatia bacterium]
MTDVAIATELEAKLLVTDPADLTRIARLARIGPYPLSRRDMVRLHSVYLDTSNHVLARHGVALRLRRCAGRWEVTLKYEGRQRGVLHERTELTLPIERAPRLPFQLTDPELRRRLTALVAGRELEASVVTDIRRRRIDVLAAAAPADAGAIAELCLDRVRVGGVPPHDRTLEYCEVEIEATGGSRQDINAMARSLRRVFELAPAHDSKLARGLRLLYGAEALRPAGAPLTADDTVEQAVRKIAGRLLQRLRRCDPGTRLGEDVEALHDMRVATRRLRALVRALGGGVPTALRGRLETELRWLGQTLGGARDADVQLNNVRGFAAGAPPGHRGGLKKLVEYLERERQARRTAMLADLDSERYTALLLSLEQFADGPARSRAAAAREPIAAAGRRAIKRAFRRLLKRGQRVEAAAPAPEDLHALRIRAKRVRYLLEFMRELTGKPGRRLTRQLVRLQDLLGAYHDAVVAADFVRQFVEGPGKEVPPSTLLALGALVGSDLRVAERTRADFQRTWKRFARPRNLDTLENLLAALETAARAKPVRQGQAGETAEDA